MEENKNLVTEVCGLNELGYPLASCQADLTIIQKHFLFKAYPIFRELQRGEGERERSGRSSYADQRKWEDRNKQLIDDKRRVTDEQRFRGHFKPY